MATSSAYSFTSISATVDGQQVQGLWDGDDVLLVEPGADAGSGTIGVDGSGIFSVSADRSAKITIKLMHTSPTHRLLTQKFKRQQSLGSTAAGFPFSLIDAGSGEGGSADRCFILTRPKDSKSKTATERVWVLWTADWNPEIPNG
ncbi:MULTISPECIES: phage protein [unclassified Sinorhizobium]|uniref:phage structural protein n=1 Tax=unclassified Sinorhizobium TaxID=2613772 RepID=UPI00352639AE